jgi:GT2 family glycosyltransferase
VGPGPTTEVDVSVVVPSFGTAGTIERCLGALRAQKTSASYELIVVESGRDGAGDLVAARFPEVRLLRFDERKLPGEGRNIGIRAARGAILAFTDADCVPAPDWVESIHKAHADPRPVVGGVVANGNPASRVGRAYYYTEFNRWLPGSPAGRVSDMPACCWSMKRVAYDRYGPFLEGTYCSDTAFHWRMAADGQQPYLEPAIAVAHVNPGRFTRCIAHEAMHGRAFARVRIAEGRMPRVVAAVRAATAPLLPFVLFARALRNAARRPGHLRDFLAVAPLAFLAMGGWSYGEASGYAARVRS